jgi:hypothetical protein
LDIQKKPTFSKKVGLLAFAASSFLITTSAQAGMDLTDVDVDTADTTSVGVLVLTAVAVLWGVKKAISFGNRG